MSSIGIVTATVISASKNGILKTKKLKEVIVISFFDSAIVSGIVFFSTFLSIGYINLNESIRISLISATVSGGLSFFTELKKSEKKIINTSEKDD